MASPQQVREDCSLIPNGKAQPSTPEPEAWSFSHPVVLKKSRRPSSLFVWFL